MPAPADDLYVARDDGPRQRFLSDIGMIARQCHGIGISGRIIEAHLGRGGRIGDIHGTQTTPDPVATQA